MNARQAGKRLANARTAKGLRLDDAAYLIRDELGPLGCSRETLRRYETGLVPPEKWDSIIIMGASAVYGVPVSELAPSIDVDAIRKVRDLLVTHSPCNPIMAGQDRRALPIAV